MDLITLNDMNASTRMMKKNTMLRCLKRSPRSISMRSSNQSDTR